MNEEDCQTHIDLSHFRSDNALEDELGNTVTLGNCARGRARGARRVKSQQWERDASLGLAERTFIVLVTQVEEENVNSSTVVGVNHTSTSVDHELAGWRREKGRRVSVSDQVGALRGAMQGLPRPLRGAIRP